MTFKENAHSVLKISAVRLAFCESLQHKT